MENEGTVMTVGGPASSADLGVTLIHEHIFVDMGVYFAGSREAESKHPNRDPSDEEFTIEMLGDARRDYSPFPTLGVLDDPELLKRELHEFTRRGGQTIVDVTSKGFYLERPGFYPAFQQHKALADTLGLNIIVGCGYYIHASHPEDMDQSSVEELEDEILREVDKGIADSGVRPGVIGEIGMSQPVHPNEWKALEAACRAQKATGLPLYVHPHFGRRGRVAPEIMRFIVRQGVDPERANACHMDGFLDLHYLRRVLDLGVNISFDLFGFEQYFDQMSYNHLPHDSQRQEMLMRLLDLGYITQLLISQDVCTKFQLKRYGGYGYGHILRNIVPALKHEGLSSAEIDQLLIENPRRFLSKGAS